MVRSFNRCFPWLFVLVLRVSSTRTRTRRYGIEYEYEYHFIEYEYEYDKSQNSATSKANGEGVALFACFGVSIDVFPGFSYSCSALAVLLLVLEDTASSTSMRIYLVKANGGNSLVDEVISDFKPEAPFLAYLPLSRSGPGSPSPCIF